MATFPARRKVVHRAIRSLLDQADLITVYCNGYSDLSEFGYSAKLQGYLGEDLGDGGKLFGIGGEYTFLVDDDIDYPKNYVARLIEVFLKTKHSRVLGCHAAKMTNPVKNYFKDRVVYHFNHRQSTNLPVNVLGTGTMAFHANHAGILGIVPKYRNMLDVDVAVYCQQNKIPMTSIRRARNWIKQLPVNASLWDSRGSGQKQTEIANQISSWTLY